MIDPTVRVASADDAAQLELLESEARASLIGQRGGDRWLATNSERGARWHTVVGVDDVVVAHIDEVIVGYLVLTLDRTDRVARVEDVYVAPEARELGFGDELLALATKRAVAAGASYLEGESLPGDRDTKNLYERAGIKARLITVSTPL